MTTWTELVGRTLLHFLWQGTVIAAIVVIALRLLRGSTAQSRYAATCAGLLAMVLAPIVTATMIAGGGDPAWARARTAAAAPSTAADRLPADLMARRDAAATPTSNATPPTDAGAARALQALSPSASVNRWLPIIVTVWLTGVGILFLRLLGGGWRVRRLYRSVRGEPMSPWQALADTLSRRLGVARHVSVVESMLVATPVVIGWLRPVVVLPVAALNALSPAQVEAILAHELAHIRRHDAAINLLQAIAETLLFYHPGVWWLSSRMRDEREHCCDDVAVEMCGDPVMYASALTELAALGVAAPLALAATGGPLTLRIRRLLRLPPDHSPRAVGGVMALGVCVLLILVMLGAGTISTAQSPAGTPGNDGFRFGPPAVNALLGFELFPMPKTWSVDDPRNARAWHVTIEDPNVTAPMLGFTGRSLIRISHGLGSIPIIGAPDWLDVESFDLTAVAEDARDLDSTRTALRRHFEEKLGLITHVESREFPVYTLVKANEDGTLGYNLTPSRVACIPGRMSGLEVQRLRARGEPLQHCGLDDDLFGLSAVGVTMQEFAESMARMSPMRPDRPVVDGTGLQGRFDVRLRLGLLPIAAIGAGHWRAGRLLQPLGFRTVFTALPEQLGLRLVKETAPFQVLVIDRINRPPRS